MFNQKLDGKQLFKNTTEPIKCFIFSKGGTF